MSSKFFVNLFQFVTQKDLNYLGLNSPYTRLYQIFGVYAFLYLSTEKIILHIFLDTAPIAVKYFLPLAIKFCNKEIMLDL